MAQQEEQKFLDLDMVAKAIPNAYDRELFQEAVNCYYAGSHRAAAILAWYAAANCLKRRIFELNDEKDSLAQKAAEKLSPGEGEIGEEKALIHCALECELIDDFERKSLEFAREMRNKCAHPTGIVPPAEAIRHVLFICSQYVLCRKGYRGLSYIENIVTIQFDDTNFFANPTMISTHCREIIERVPPRLWPLFFKTAADKRGDTHTETWRNNAYTFFGQVFAYADDSLINDLALSVQSFESKSLEFFAVLGGIDKRVSHLLGHHKRTQIRARLRQSSAMKLRSDEVHAWATICAEDGFESDDLDLLRDKFAPLARFLLAEEHLLEKRQLEIIDVIEKLIRNDETSRMAAMGCKNLFPTKLFDHINTDQMHLLVTNILNEVIVRFLDEPKHRELMDEVKKWNSSLLVKLLESAPRFLVECSEDNPEDVVFLFYAKQELENRYYYAIPTSFADTIRSVLKGSLMPEWNSDESTVGRIFRSQLNAEELSERIITTKPQEQIEIPQETDEFWYSRLGVKVSPRQEQLLSLFTKYGGMSAVDIVEITDSALDEVSQDIQYLELQALIVRQDEKYTLREDLHSLLAEV